MSDKSKKKNGFKKTSPKQKIGASEAKGSSKKRIDKSLMKD
jgi:hypothetical protein